MQATSKDLSPAIDAGFQSNDYHRLPATEKQLVYARELARKSGAVLPMEVRQDRRALSRWIDDHRPPSVAGQFANYPSSKQVAYAERIARLKRRIVPNECFHDRALMSKWIDGNR